MYHITPNVRQNEDHVEKRPWKRIPDHLLRILQKALVDIIITQ